MEEAIQFRELFRETQKKLNALSQKQEVFSDISLTQSNALIEIGRTKSITVNDLSKTLERDKSSVSRLVKSMEKSHWIFLEANSTDGRIRNIKLTDKGKQKYIAIESAMNQLFSKFIAGFSKQEYKALMDSLHLLIKTSNNI